VRFAGELSAVGTAVCWAAGSNLFAGAGRRMGSVVLNRLRISTALVLLAITLLVTRGAAWPTWATPAQIGVLSLSGLIGFVFGDTWYFRSLVILGPSRATLLACLAPLFTTIIAWPLLHELPGPTAMFGMALTLGGIAWVMRVRGGWNDSHPEGSVATGVLAGALGALGQAGGYVLSKSAVQSGLDPLSATVIRVTAAAIAIWAMAGAERQLKVTVAALRDRRASAFMVGGAFCGPFLGVTLSLNALRYIEAGVAASITAFYPVLATLIASRAHNEKLSWKLLAGALVAVAGVVVLFLR
jgi:drug/metabolite transporter (DMT)-like permease